MTLYSTAGLDSSRQLSRWQEIMGDVYYPVDVIADRRHGIRGELVEQAIGHASLTRVDCDHQRVLRTRERISRDGDDSYVIVFPEAGQLYFEHQGRNGYRKAGGYIVVLSSEYYELACSDNFRNMTVRIPAGRLEKEYPRAWDHCGARYRSANGCATILRGFLHSIWQLDDETRQQLAEDLSAEITRLAAMLLRNEIHHENIDAAGSARSGAGTGTGTGYLYREIAGQIRGHHAEEPFSVKEVARQLRISPSYVNRILASHQTSFGRLMKESHLQVAYELLTNPRMQHLSIKEVMYRSGFTNFSHFCYAFKAQFGCTAGDARQTLAHL